jgi:sec-independent protein translocase protein TatB
VFNQVGWGEIIVLLLVGLFVFGPERLPKAARDAGRMLRELRRMANGVQEDIRNELGPEFADLDVRSLHPKAFVQKHLFDDDPDDPLIPSYLTKRSPLDRNPLELPDVKSFLADGSGRGSGNGYAPGNGAGNGHRPSLTKPATSLPPVPGPRATEPDAAAPFDPAPFDADAT